MHQITPGSNEKLEYHKRKEQNTITQIITVAGLDYRKFKIHHFKRPTETKAEQNPRLYVNPKRIFRVGQHLTQSQNEMSTPL